MIINPRNIGKKLDTHDCYYCGCHDTKVEAGGMWHCPNPHCTGCGVAWFCSKLKSYKNRGDRYTVNGYEKKYAADLYLNCKDAFDKVYK